MRALVRTISFGLLLGAIPLSVLAECNADYSDEAKSIQIGNSQINARILNSSFLSSINYHRCKEGLEGLSYDPKLDAAARFHSNWMNVTKVFAHENLTTGMEHPWDRAEHFDYAYSIVAENLALFPVFNFRNRPFYVDGLCNFTSESGEKIPRMSYAQIAEQVGIGWMNSPGHRANILLESITEAAVGIAIDQSAEHCGKVYITMVYGKPLN